MIVRRPVPLLASLSILAIAGLAPAFARAQGVDEFGPYGGEDEHKQSPQHVAVEVRVGRYRPDIDKQFGASEGPYEQTFGKKLRVSFGTEVDWQLLRIPHFGSLGPGVGWAYTSISAKAPYTDGSGISEQKTTLKLMPMYAVGVLRVDVLAKETRVPLVPYAKAGLGYGLWWAVTAEKVERVNGVAARGSSHGYNFALGGMLLLNSFDRRSAVDMDAELGINRAYVFGEWYKSSLDGFGSGDQMQIGTSTWVLGVAFEI